MSENTETSTAVAGENNEQGEQAKGFDAITSQEDFDKAIQARLARERAKIPADYAEVKAKAERLEQIEAESMTEADKQKKALEDARAELAALTVAKTRAEVAASTGIPAELIAGPASGSAEDVEAFAKALDAWGKTAKKGPSSPAIGRANSATASSDADALTILGFS